MDSKTKLDKFLILPRWVQVYPFLVGSREGNPCQIYNKMRSCCLEKARLIEQEMYIVPGGVLHGITRDKVLGNIIKQR